MGVGVEKCIVCVCVCVFVSEGGSFEGVRSAHADWADCTYTWTEVIQGLQQLR